jgi:hypothetical protein
MEIGFFELIGRQMHFIAAAEAAVLKGVLEDSAKAGALLSKNYYCDSVSIVEI